MGEEVYDRATQRHIKIIIIHFILPCSKCARCFARLLNTFAEEQAIEDALYYLSEALQRGVIDSDQFLKVGNTWLPTIQCLPTMLCLPTMPCIFSKFSSTNSFRTHLPFGYHLFYSHSDFRDPCFQR